MPVNRQQFAAALAQGIDPAIFVDWAQQLPRTSRVMVPIRVDALVVREAGGNWADCRLGEPEAGATGVDATELLPQPFANLPGGRQPGVYLHWALPDALTRGVAGANPEGGAAFPAIPDRWLVARIGGGGQGSRRAVGAWVIESGGPAPKATPLAAWSEPGPVPAGNPGGPEKPLTALGHGDPAWAAYFDNVVGRLAFYDPLADLSQGPLAYLVCGWYSSPALDPLGDSITSVARFEQRLAELRWEVPPGSYGYSADHHMKMQLLSAAAKQVAAGPAGPQPVGPADRMSLDAGAMMAKAPGVTRAARDFAGKPVDGYFSMGDGWWPRQTLCHGSVVGLGWPSPGLAAATTGPLAGEQVGGPPPASKVKVAFGHSMTDAMAALLAANGQSPDQARALEMALLGASDQLNEPDAASQVDVRLHSACFGALPSAPTTETIRQAPLGTPSPQRHADPSRTSPGIFKGKVPGPGKAGPAMAGPARLATLAQAGVRLSTNPATSGVRLWENRKLVDIVADRRLQRSVGAAASAGDDAPREVAVERASPRFFIPGDPVVLVQGVDRSFKHGGDRLNSQSGRLPCRVSGMVTRSLSPAALQGAGGGRVTGADLLSGGVAHGGVPTECGELLGEVALLDPGSASFAARAGARSQARMAAPALERAAQVYAVEQTAWWATWDPRRDGALLAAKSGFDGTLPCGLAVTPPLKPWVPLHLDWEVEYAPTPAGADDWDLEEIDFDVRPSALPDAPDPAPLVLSGRALLTGGAAQTAAAAVRQTIEKSASAGGSAALRPAQVIAFNSELARTLLQSLGEISVSGHAAAQQDDLRSLADSLAEMDVLAGALDNFHTRLRGGFTGDGVAAPAAGEPAPDPFIPLRAGFLRVRRLRLVDCFGQFLDLAGSSETSGVDMSKVIRSEPMQVAGHPELLELAPRFTAPARLLFRFVGADDDAAEATDALSPLCGYLLPDHLDAELQIHGADGGALGSVRFDPAAGVAFEVAPGLPTPLGADPGRTIANTHLARLAQGLLDWGMADVTRADATNSDTALSALLRIVDTTLWTVDPFGHSGEEHLSLLVGHPVAVLRARLTLEVADPIRSEALQGHRIPVRLGALAHWQDGLLGYFVDDDYMTLRVPDPAAAGFARPLGPGQGFLGQATQTSDYYTAFAAEIGLTALTGDSPVTHDFVDPAGLIYIRPGQTIMLTMLVEPHSLVHATCGLLPRKSIGMRRQWVAPGLANIAPIFRFGPVLVEPKRIRMPVASELGGSWSWCHRVDPVSWQEDEVVNSRGDTQLPTGTVEAQEGWLRLTPEKPGGPS